MRINVKVIPNSKSNRLVQEEGRSRVYLTMPINDPNPNKVLLKFLAAHFCVNKNVISIISGEDKREKLVQVIKG